MLNAVSSGNGLLTDLLAYYKLDEASGDALDAHTGAKDLTDTNTVGAATGKINGGRDFEADTNEYFVRTDADFNMASAGVAIDFTMSAWVNLETNDETTSYGRGIFSYLTAESIGNWAVSIRGGATNKIYLYHWESSGADADGRKAFSSTLSTSTWYHIVARRSSGTYTVWVNGASQTADTSLTTDSGWGTRNAVMGSMWIGGGSNYVLDGIIDELGIWKRALSDSDIATLYNSGSGYAYSNFTS